MPECHANRTESRISSKSKLVRWNVPPAIFHSLFSFNPRTHKPRIPDILTPHVYIVPVLSYALIQSMLRNQTRRKKCQVPHHKGTSRPHLSLFSLYLYISRLFEIRQAGGQKLLRKKKPSNTHCMHTSRALDNILWIQAR